MHIDVAFLNGHTINSPGSIGVESDNDTISEFDFSAMLAMQFQNAGLPFTQAHFERPTGERVEQASLRIMERIATYTPKAIVEIHFNYLDPGTFRPDSWLWDATTALYAPGYEEAERLGECLVNKVSGLLGTPNRKIQKQTRSWSSNTRYDNGNRGPNGPTLTTLLEGRRHRIPTVILETHVGNKPEWHDKAMAALRDHSLADAIAAGLHEFLLLGGAA
jgi:hypothetical protein